ncbi:MAG: hypothetical protein GY929_07985 [Actinomycetia bacterium]|nr:hypothetical protein [Actinomycetes bacterium]
MARSRSELIIIFWRDIPAQVNAQVGRARHQVVLGERFQRAIDQAKGKAHIYTADEDVAQWRRETRALSGQPQTAAAAVATEIEAAYPAHRLRDLARAAGSADPPAHPDTDREQ